MFSCVSKNVHILFPFFIPLPVQIPPLFLFGDSDLSNWPSNALTEDCHSEVIGNRTQFHKSHVVL